MVVDGEQNPDLLWASRGGGGGNFGVVTELTFRLQPVDMPFTNVDYTFAWASALKVLRAWQQWTQDRPPEGHGYVQLITGDPAGDGATVSVELTFVGSPERAKDPCRRTSSRRPAATRSERANCLAPSSRPSATGWCAGLRPEECGYAGITPGGTIPRYALTAKSDFVFKPWPDEGLALIIDAIARGRPTGS